MQVRKLTLKGDRVKVVNWIRSGAPLKEGIPLYASLFPDAGFLAELKKNPDDNREKLYLTFCDMMDITYQRFEQIVNEWHAKQKSTNTGSTATQPGSNGQENKRSNAGTEQTQNTRKRSFRSEWPYLSDPTCPPQLKALAADKISCWERYTEAHKNLFDCSSLDECYQVAKILIDNYKENRQIYEELDYYKQHGAVLGQHRVFDQYKRFDELKGKNVIELVQLYNKTLPHRIWRIENEMKKGDKPHLNSDREARLRDVQAELAEVKRILGINN
ncbi:MAG: hypothetical protein JZU47_10955 [Prolixibacteraceae bacterium]|nr:hypothetical protein [Prolixibacteraceae bacterium]